MSGSRVPIRYVEANGLLFAYLEEGAGPLVLLLHGFPDTAHTWDLVRGRLATAGFRAVSPFQRGYRPTAIPTRDTDAETMARDALALIEALGERQAIVIGHDWGANAAYGAAGIDPSRISKLVALAIPQPATLRPLPAKLWGVRHFITNKLPGAAERFAANDFAALPAIYKRWSPTWGPAPEEFDDVRACFEDRASLDAAFGYYRALKPVMPAFLRKRSSVPTIAFCGRDDPMATIDDFRHAAKIFDGSYAIEEVPGGHFMHREHPEPFIERLLAHLR